MIKKNKVKFKDGSVKTQIRVVEGIRSGNKIIHRHIKGFGYLEDNEDQNAFLKMVKEFDENYQHSKKIQIELDTQESWLNDEDDKVYNFGYKFIEAIYNKLNLKSFFDNTKFQGKYNLNEVFKFLVIHRLLNPDSKRATYQRKDNLFGVHTNFELHDIYRSLSYYDKHSDELQKHLNERIKELIGRNSEKSFYDTTNYHFEIDFEDEDCYVQLDEKIVDKKEIKDRRIIEKQIDGVIKQFEPISGFKKRGVSKKHQVTPIVQLSLMIDDNGLPVCMRLFPGNTSDGKTLQPTIENVKKNFKLKRLLIIADKGINTSSNIDYIINQGDGFLFSQVLRGKKGYRYHEKLFDESLYTVINDDNKYQTFIEEYDGLDSFNNKVTRKRKVLLYYSGEDARRTKKKREEKIDKAKNLIRLGLATTSHGTDKYINSIASIKNTGEIADNIQLRLDQEKIEKESKFDGYSCIVTSELDYDYKKMIETYRGLWKIEESFRISQSDLYVRPIYLTTEGHIRGHFITCFTSLLIIRMFQLKLNYELSVERIIRALNFCGCIKITRGILKLVKSESLIDFETRKSTNNIEYITMKKSNESETIKDIRFIFDKFNIPEYGKFLRSDKFETQLSRITYIK
ncbi:MAG: IS1634 family transposase [Firmicutes bacterium]|nr:IS1634 family transposase [Bacillota bacterium]